jgi:thioredoxin 1
VLLEFGAGWCGHCQALRPDLDALLRAHPGVRHLRIEDGPGKPLGRSFRVKLWPTLVFLREGQVLRLAVRPRRDEVAAGFAALTGSESPEQPPGENVERG